MVVMEDLLYEPEICKHWNTHRLTSSLTAVSLNWTGGKWKVGRRLSTADEQTERDGVIVKGIENNCWI